MAFAFPKKRRNGRLCGIFNLKYGRPDPSAPRRANTPMRPLKGSPAGGGYSTVDDMLRFSLALRDHKLLNQKYTDIITTGKIETGAPGRKYAYG
jgi:hypothetical protein